MQLELQDFNQNFQILSSAFDHFINKDYLVSTTSTNQLTDIFHQNFKTKQKLNVLLYGQKGFGKKTSIYLNSMLYEKKCQENLIIIYLNAMIHNNDANFIDAFLSQLKNYIPHNVSKDAVFSGQVKLDIINEIFTQNQNYSGLVLIIDQINILSASKRQYFFYSILEWLKGLNFPIIFCGLTNDLMFQDTLEKRVKSRYQNMYRITSINIIRNLFFFNYTMDDVVSIVKARLAKVQSKSLKQTYTKFFESQEFKKFVMQKQNLQLSIGDILKIIRTSFGFVKLGQTNLMESINKGYELYFPDIEYELGLQLNQPEYIILFAISKIIDHKKQQIFFADVLAYINSFKQYYKVNLGGTTISNFSNHVYNKALENLIKLEIIQLENKNSKNLENNQIILKMPLQVVKNVKNTIQGDQSDFINKLYEIDIV